MYFDIFNAITKYILMFKQIININESQYLICDLYLKKNAQGNERK